MARQKKKLTAEQRRAKRERRKNFEMVFINGKQKWIRKTPLIDGVTYEEFIRANADDCWLVENGEYEELHRRAMESSATQPTNDHGHSEIDTAQ